MKLNKFLEKLKTQGLSKGNPDSDFDPIELEIGAAVELEHFDNKESAKEIAKDHLVENPHYYTKILAPAEDEVMYKVKEILKKHGYENIEDWKNEKE